MTILKTFDILLEEWLDYIKKQVKPSTYACYTRLSFTHLLPYFKDKYVSEMGQNAIADFIQGKLDHGRIDQKGGLSEKTVKDLVTLLKSVMKYAQIIEHQTIPEFLGWRYNITRKKIDVFDEKELIRMENVLLNSKELPALGIILCLYSGLRLGEICGLQWKDIDLNQKIIYVKRTVQRIYTPDNKKHTQLFVGTPKTASSIRDIPITFLLCQHLQNISFPEEAYFITGKVGKIPDPRTYQKKYKKYLEMCGVTYRNFHALRHTFATRCIEKGVDIKSTSEILGHSNVNITLNCYVHSSMTQKRKQLERLCLQL